MKITGGPGIWFLGVRKKPKFRPKPGSRRPVLKSKPANAKLAKFLDDFAKNNLGKETLR